MTQKTVNLDEFDQFLSNENNEADYIDPVFNENYVSICIVSSEEYSAITGVLVQSIIYNSSSDNLYDIVILTDSMFLRNQWRIKNLKQDYKNISIRFVDINNIIKDYEFYTWAHFTQNTYYRLLIPDLFYKYDKTLYLDADIIVNSDIAELFDIDMENNFLAAAYDTHVVSYCTRKPPLEQLEYNKNILKLKNPKEYYQMGVCIYNNKKINENFNKEYLITKASNSELKWLDQDLLNMVFHQKIFRLPNEWNVMIANIIDNIDEYHLPDNLRKEYFESRKNPKIIHYVGKGLPCFSLNSDLYEYFWKYARITPFYEKLIQQSMEQYTHNVMHYYLSENSITSKIKRYIKLLIDKLFPMGSKRRKFVKEKILNKREIYYSK